MDMGDEGDDSQVPSDIDSQVLVELIEVVFACCLSSLSLGFSDVVASLLHTAT